MARIPRLVVPGFPYHVTQRGNRQLKTLFSTEDYQYYPDLLEDYKDDLGVSVWTYCLIPNNVHLAVVPDEEDSLSRLFRRVHRDYSRYVDFRENWGSHCDGRGLVACQRARPGAKFRAGSIRSCAGRLGMVQRQIASAWT